MWWWCYYLVDQSYLILVTPCTEIHQAPLSMGFPRQEYWSGLLFPSPGNFSDSGIEPTSPALAGGFWATWEAQLYCDWSVYCLPKSEAKINNLVFRLSFVLAMPLNRILLASCISVSLSVLWLHILLMLLDSVALSSLLSSLPWPVADPWHHP